MKRILAKILKLILILLYPVIVVLLVVVSGILFLRMRNINDALEKYRKVDAEYSYVVARPFGADVSISNAMDHIASIIENLSNSLEESSTEIGELKDKIESEQKDGFGEIRGSILAFVSQGQSFNRYQRVCAETKANKNKQHCVSVSAIGKKYILVVPEGEYYVFAQLQDSPENLNKAYYTEFVTCNQSEEPSCDENLSEKKILVKVESGETITGIDPIDWKLEGINLTDKIQEDQSDADDSN